MTNPKFLNHVYIINKSNNNVSVNTSGMNQNYISHLTRCVCRAFLVPILSL